MTMSTRRQRGSAVADTATRQITELAQAFRAFARNMPGLSVEVVGHVAGNRHFVHPVAGFHVRLSENGDVGTELYVSSTYGELTRWRPGAGALRERFEVRIDEPGYVWGDSAFPTAHELAHDLLAYMQFNLDAIRRN